MNITTKSPPPIRVKRRQAAPPPAPSLDFTKPPALAPRPPSPWLQSVEPFQAPVGPARVKFRRRIKGDGVLVTRPPWGTLFRIVEGDPENPQGPCTIVWTGRGAGALRSAPADFKSIGCENRRLAQELILVLYRDWLTRPARASLLARIRSELRGKVLVCNCGPKTPCHGDVLLELANS